MIVFQFFLVGCCQIAHENCLRPSATQPVTYDLLTENEHTTDSDFNPVVLFFVLLAKPMGSLKDKSRVGIFVDYSRYYTVANGVQYVFQFFSCLICETKYFNLLQSAK